MGSHVATNQVLYNLTRRGIEYDLLPWCHEHGLPIMAYSPIEQGRLLNHPALQSVAARHGATPAQVSLAWVLRRDRLIAIPKAACRRTCGIIVPRSTSISRTRISKHSTARSLPRLARVR